MKIGLGLGIPDARHVISGAAAWTPAALFASSEVGAWYDPSDLSSMYQDASATTPVTAAGDPVGYIADKSGNGNHATQPIDNAYRPLLQQDASGNWYLDFDGSDDYLVGPDGILVGTGDLSVFVGIYKDTDTQIAGAVEYSINNTTNYTFTLWAPLASGSAEYVSRIKDTAGDLVDSGNTFPFGNLHVVTLLGKIDSDRFSTQRINGAQTGTTTTGFGTAGTFGNNPLYIARRGTGSFFNGRIYGLIIRGAQTTGTTLDNAEAYVAGKTGATLA